MILFNLTIPYPSMPPSLEAPVTTTFSKPSSLSNLLQRFSNCFGVIDLRIFKTSISQDKRSSSKFSFSTVSFNDSLLSGLIEVVLFLNRSLLTFAAVTNSVFWPF